MLALKQATRTIPIVGMSSDPVAYGIVTSLSRPEANITGVVVDAGAELWGKRLQLLTEVAPATSKVFLVIPKASSESGIVRGAVEAAARQVGLSLSGPAIESPTQEPEYRRAFGDAVAFGSNAAIVSTSPENYSARRWIVELAAKNRLPPIYPSRDFAEIGGLMAYDIDIFDLYRRVAHQIDTILKGTRPADIPVYQPTKFELAGESETRQGDWPRCAAGARRPRG